MKSQIRKLFSWLNVFHKKKTGKWRAVTHKMVFSRLKNFIPKRSKSCEKKTREEIDLYSLNRYQLKNLMDKNIHFGFFQLENFSCGYDRETEALLKKLKKKTEEELLSDLKDQDLKQPLVFICEKGFISKALAQKLRDHHFINVYFVKGGLKGLLKDKNEE